MYTVSRAVPTRHFGCSGFPWNRGYGPCRAAFEPRGTGLASLGPRAAPLGPCVKAATPLSASCSSSVTPTAAGTARPACFHAVGAGSRPEHLVVVDPELYARRSGPFRPVRSCRNDPSEGRVLQCRACQHCLIERSREVSHVVEARCARVRRRVHSKRPGPSRSPRRRSPRASHHLRRSQARSRSRCSR